jgi:hypothetical protein
MIRLRIRSVDLQRQSRSLTVAKLATIAAMRADTFVRDVCKRPGCGKLAWIGLNCSGAPHQFCGRTCSRLHQSVQDSNTAATKWDFISAAAYSPSISRHYATPQMRDFIERGRTSNSSAVSSEVPPGQHVSLHSTSLDTPGTKMDRTRGPMTWSPLRLSYVSGSTKKTCASPTSFRAVIFFK